MALNFKTFWNGIKLKAKAALTGDSKGDIEVLNSDGKLYYHNGSTSSPVITESHSATLLNKTIDADLNTIADLELDNLKAGVLNVSTTLAGATDLQVPSALAVKTFVDNSAGAVQTDVDDLITLSGRPTNSVNLGTFTGVIIPDNSTVKAALQDLEDATQMVGDDLGAHVIDAVDAHDASAISSIPSGNLAATEVQAALNELQSDIDTRALDSALTAHLNDAVDAHDASAISFTPVGSIAATDAQAAIAEVATDADTALSTHAGLTAAHGATGAVVGTTNTQTLTNKTITGADFRTPVRSDVKQDTLANLTTYALTASNGQLVFATDTKEMYQVVDTVLTPVGGGSGTTDVDILAQQTFEDVSLGDFTQTGLTFNTTNPVHGTQSAELIHQAGINQSFKQTLAVDRKFRSQMVELSLNVRSTATTGNLTLLVTDETNATTIAASQSIQTGSFAITATTAISTTLSGISNTDINLLYVGMAVSGAGIQTNTVINSINTAAGTAVISVAGTAAATVSLRISTLPITRTFSFTVPSNCLSMSYTVTALPEANSPRSTVDDVVLKLASVSLLETSVTVPVITEWVAYTPTFTGFGTVSTSAIYWRQVGDSVELRGSFLAGTPTAVEARLTLPNSYNVDTNVATVAYAGDWRYAVATQTTVGSVLIEPSVGYVTFSANYPANANNPLTKTTGSNVASANTLHINARIPISGLAATTTTAIPLTQSGIIQAPDSTLTVDSGNGHGSTNTRIRRFVNVRQALGTDITYADSATLGASFTANTAGVYTISYTDRATGASQTLAITVNDTAPTTTAATPLTYAQGLRAMVQAASTVTGFVEWTGYLNAGDIVRAHTEGSATAGDSQCMFTISKQGSLKQVSVNTNSKITIPTSELRFEGASARGAVATAIVKFDTQAKIRGDAFTVTNTANEGTFVTMTKAGRLSISAGIHTAGSVASLSRNQSILTAVPVASETLASSGSTTSGNSVCALSWTGDVAVGDILRVVCTTNPTTNIANQFNLSFQEQDIQVSVSNTLPQFSESDSSVRLDTANGYGSTATKIRRFSNTRDNIGTDVVYADSATAGSSFTVMSDGLYNISYIDGFSAASYLGITKNTSSSSTSVSSLATAPGTTSEVLAITVVSGIGQVGNVSCQAYLQVGDVIRPHSDGVAASDNDWTKFLISKVGRPQVTGVDVTPFVNAQILGEKEVTELYLADGTLTTGTIINWATANLTGNAGTYTPATGTFTVVKPGLYIAYFSGARSAVAGGVTNIQININGVEAARDATGGTAGDHGACSISRKLVAGDTISFATSGGGVNSSIAGVTFEEYSTPDALITPIESFSTDTASLTYASSATYTLSTLSTAPVGTFITFTYAASTNTRTQTTTVPTQTTADMNTNGILIYTRVFGSASTAALPAVVAVQIGKGLKGVSLGLYKSAAKVNAGSLDLSVATSTVTAGMNFKSYNENTGILYLDAGYSENGTDTSKVFRFADLTTQTSGYLVINASKSPALAGVPLLQPRIATISNVQPSGTSAGGSTVSTYVTRVLNTLSDPTGIVTSLASNQFVLAAGEYYFNGTYEGYSCVHHRTRLRNITLGADALLGTNGYSPNSASANSTHSNIRGTIVITSPTTFEVQHWTGATIAGNGLGTDSSSGSNNVYAVTQIVKVK